MAEEEHPRHRQTFLGQLREHCEHLDTRSAPASSRRGLQAILERLAAELRNVAEEDPEYQWDWDEEASCGPFEPLMPDIFSVLDDAAECLRQNDAEAARDAYAAVWAMVDIENDYGHSPRLEEADEALTREHSARYLRAVLLTTPSVQQVPTLLQAAQEVRFSGIVSRPETRYCTLREIAEVEVTPLPG